MGFCWRSQRRAARPTDIVRLKRGIGAARSGAWGFTAGFTPVRAGTWSGAARAKIGGIGAGVLPLLAHRRPPSPVEAQAGLGAGRIGARGSARATGETKGDAGEAMAEAAATSSGAWGCWWCRPVPGCVGLRGPRSVSAGIVTLLPMQRRKRYGTTIRLVTSRNWQHTTAHLLQRQGGTLRRAAKQAGVLTQIRKAMHADGAGAHGSAQFVGFGHSICGSEEHAGLRPISVHQCASPF
jgi:hypothetical protein